MVAFQVRKPYREVYKILQQAGVMRKPWEKRHLQGSLVLGEDELGWIDGWLLGDGCLRFTGAGARPSHSSSIKAYSTYVMEFWRKVGLSVDCLRLYDVRQVTGVTTQIWQFQGRSHGDLQAIYQRWYPEGVKVLPADLVISGRVLREWFIGDGTTRRRLLTGMGKEQAEVLRGKLELLGLKVGFSQRKDHPHICTFTIDAESSSLFRSLVGPEPFPEYAYKWRDF